MDFPCLFTGLKTIHLPKKDLNSVENYFMMVFCRLMEIFPVHPAISKLLDSEPLNMTEAMGMADHIHYGMPRFFLTLPDKNIFTGMEHSQL